MLLCFFVLLFFDKYLLKFIVFFLSKIALHLSSKGFKFYVNFFDFLSIFGVNEKSFFANESTRINVSSFFFL